MHPSVTQESVTVCSPSPNPRVKCARCYRPELCTEKSGVTPGESNPDGGTTGLVGQVAPPPTLPATDHTRPRDMDLERTLIDTAARAAGHTTDYGLRDFADARAWPGGVRDMDFDQEIAEELADASSYAVWSIETIYDQVIAGDPLALDRYERTMRALAKIIEAWKELRTESA